MADTATVGIETGSVAEWVPRNYFSQSSIAASVKQVIFTNAFLDTADSSIFSGASPPQPFANRQDTGDAVPAYVISRITDYSLDADQLPPYRV